MLVLMLALLPRDGADLVVDKTVFFDTFGEIHGADWAGGSGSGKELAAVLEQILGAPLDASARNICDESFEKISKKWRGGDVRLV